MQDKPKDKLKPLRAIVPALLSVVILAIAFFSVDLAAMRGAFARLSVFTLAGALATVLAVDVIGALRWWFLIPGARFSALCVSYLCSRFFLLVPGGAIVSDASRLMLIGGSAGGYQSAASTVLVDKLTSSVPMLIYCLIGMAMSSRPMPGAVWAAVIALLTLMISVIAAAMGGALRPLAARLAFIRRYRPGRAVVDQLESLSGVMGELRGQPARFAAHLAAGFANDAGLIAITAIVGGALAPNVLLSDWASVSTLASLAMFLPVTVGGVGLREGAFVATLALLAVPSPVALAISLVISGLNIVNNLLGGAIYLMLRGRTLGADAQPKEKHT